MDLSTTYMGFKMAHPLIAGAGPLVDNLDSVKRLEDAGAAAIVMHSLFEEQIPRKRTRASADSAPWADMYANAVSYFPQPGEFAMQPEKYLEHIRRIKEATAVPLIASLNGTAPSAWLHFSERMQEAGADALEFNLYHVPTDPQETGADVEQRVLDCVRILKECVSIPIAVKLSPYYSALANLAARLDGLGVEGLVLFNRVYKPEIDAVLMDVGSRLYSNSAELPVRLRWLGILRGQVRASLAASGGVHSSLDAVKAVMAGADAVQMVSALLEKGPEFLRAVREGMEKWMAEHEFASLREIRGVMSLQYCPDSAGYERAAYARVLQSWHR